MLSTAQASLYAGFSDSAARHPARPAVWVEGTEVSYEELERRVARLARVIDTHAGTNRLAGLLANRSLAAYTGILATLHSGRGYVPLNPKHPVQRLARVLRQSDVSVVIAGAEGYAPLRELLEGAEHPLTVILPDVAPGDFTLPSSARAHRVLFGPAVHASRALDPVLAVGPESLAYLLFTSGSTGEPKGVAVTHANVRSYATTVRERFALGPDDRCSQMSDLSFDWSVHDLYACWDAGACLISIPESSHLAPAKLMREQRITSWAAVPSSVGIMLGMRMLKPGAFPTIRVSTFCGEPLPATHAAAWQNAAPNSIVENFYGPTETTVAITAFRWDPATSPARSQGGIVPIGWPFEGQQVRIVDGELLLGGDQVALGYWKNPEETARRFVRLEGEGDQRWYRTGDRVRQDPDGCLQYLGRMDDQVKIRGYRVELQEIDHVVRGAAAADMVMTVAWPVHDGSADGVVTFVAGARERRVDPILAACRAALPEYMVPREIRFLDALPLSANGKIDRKQLVDILRQKASQ
jgi:amino acid adenylation domain-containing protein